MKKQTGIVTGTGATLNVATGFKPDKVSVYNETTRTRVEALFMTTTSAGDGPGGSKVHTEAVTAHGLNTSAAGAVTAMASAAAGLSQYAGAAGAESQGFTIGASAVPNVNTNVLVWEAEQFD